MFVSLPLCYSGFVRSWPWRGSAPTELRRCDRLWRANCWRGAQALTYGTGPSPSFLSKRPWSSTTDTTDLPGRRCGSSPTPARTRRRCAASDQLELNRMYEWTTTWQFNKLTNCTANISEWKQWCEWDKSFLFFFCKWRKAITLVSARLRWWGTAYAIAYYYLPFDHILSD